MSCCLKVEEILRFLFLRAVSKSQKLFLFYNYRVENLIKVCREFRLPTPNLKYMSITIYFLFSFYVY